MMKKIAPLLLTASMLGGCLNFWKEEKDPLPGMRHVVFLNQDALRPDPSIASTNLTLPAPEPRAIWPMASAVADHAPSPVKLGGTLQEAWRGDIGVSSHGKLLSGPVVAQDTVFAVDTNGDVSAFSLETGALLWRVETVDASHEYQPFGGGLCWDEGKIFVTTPSAEVVCMDAKDGTVLWRKALTAPSRCAPTPYKGAVYVLTTNNQLTALSAKDGAPLWTHVGMMESAGLLGGASPAVQGNTLVVAYTSGEVYGLTADTGHALWVESLNSPGAVDSLSSLAHIKARPVISDGMAFVMSHAGRMSAIDLRTGQFVWTRPLGGVHTPAVWGEALFFVTSDNHLVCCDKRSGGVRWSKALPERENYEEDGEALFWAGPILVDGELVLTGSSGKIIFCSPKDGAITRVLNGSDTFFLSPIAVSNALIALGDSGNLVTFKQG